ncbi:MAG: YmdB family metallophosphoesterase [Spirochaetaceae bacterium]|nr:YmdB family metallophosphoesterase [Spirochaetaceae bacterium]
MKILYIAEITGKAGIHAIKHCLAAAKKEHGVSFVIACADGATGGNGLGRNHAAYLHKLGADVLTLGECCFYKKDLVENMARLPWVLRPENLNAPAPGLGARVYRTGAGGEKIAVAVLLGQSGFSRLHGENPFARLPVLLERLKQETPFVVVDFHAAATAEKHTLFALAAGRAGAVIGSHTRVQTADAAVLAGVAVITDAGRTGSAESVGGADIESRIREYLSGIPDWTKDAWQKPELQGVVIELDRTGKALSIKTVRYAAPPMARPPAANGGAEDAAEADPEETA